MDYFGYAYFVERPRRIENLMVPHLVEKERPYRIITEIQLPAIDYENYMDSADNCVALCPNCHRKMHMLNDPNDVNILKAISNHR